MGIIKKLQLSFFYVGRSRREKEYRVTMIIIETKMAISSPKDRPDDVTAAVADDSAGIIQVAQRAWT